MTKAGIWALGFTPGPLFASWYFLFRRRYVIGTAIGGSALTFFVLTGDMPMIVALVGVLGAVGTIGFGDLDNASRTAGWSDERVHLESNRTMGKQLSRRMLLMAIATTSVSFVPGGEARPLLPGGGNTTLEGSLLEASSRLSILGSIRLSPTVRFTVTAETADYWRVGAYDRYTGDEWIRTGNTQPYSEQLSRPEGQDIQRIRQTYEVESAVATMPAAWKPVRVGVGADQTHVTDMDGLQPAGKFEAGDQYSVESFKNVPSSEALRNAGTDYPASFEERYGQLPETTPARVQTFAAELTANAGNPYDTAAISERWLHRNKDYSLDVNRPNGDIAASFLFEMDRGYCVCLATAIVVMLRRLGIPTRFAVGYTARQQVA
jgi:transglutaminase-like putative cysteine protease